MLSNVASPAKSLKIFKVVHSPAVFYGYPMIDFEPSSFAAGHAGPMVPVQHLEPHLGPLAPARAFRPSPRHYPANPKLRMLGGSDFLAKAPHARTKAAATSSLDAFW